MSDLPVSKIMELAAEGKDTVVRYLQELIGVPSMSTQEGEVIERVSVQMREAGIRQIRVDRLGNIIGTVGSGPNLLAFDAHMDTVDVGDLDAWDIKPFEAVVKDGFVFGRGASDQKGGMAAMMLAAHIWRHVGLPEGMTVMLVGSIMEEDSDGLCWQYIVNEERYVPSWVVLTEPTNLAVNHGQRGRVEIDVTTLGRSAHAASPEQGTNAVYLMTPIINAIRKMGSKLTDDEYLGKGSVAVTEITSRAPSLCAIPDLCRIHLDRRLTAGETDEASVGEIRSLPEVRAANAGVAIPDYSRPSYRGLHYMVKKYYPPWVLDREHVLVKAGLQAAETVLGAAARLGTWNFSTNGVATMGMFGIPTIGFGPSEEKYAHTPEDRCPIDHLVTAAAFYALLPWVLHRMAPMKKEEEGQTSDSRT
ncbi:YgeY family selenium metabolism-linked hydrolase [Candidatus Fermentibacteria bacterium]|nr:YgeY family selenium metabolism-linked hydrolase [Candidatus Fermentibacteria bacterium]